MKSVKSRIYIQAFGVTYKVIDVRMNDDGSIYTYFPHKLGYSVKSLIPIELRNKNSKTLSLNDNILSETLDPYLTYHPGKGVVHVNAKDNKGTDIKFVSDRLSYSLDEVRKSDNFYPIATIVVPAYVLHFDKVENPSKMNLTIISPEDSYQATTIDILLHRSGGHIDPSYYTTKDKVFRLQHVLTSPLTYSMLVRHVPSTTGTEPRDLMIVLPNKEKHLGVRLSPK